MTYYVKTDDEHFTNRLTQELEDRGFKEGKLPVKFVFLSGKWAYQRHRIDLKKSELTNLIQYPSITDKINLHQQFRGEPFIKDFDILSPSKKQYLPELPSHFLKILKPVDGYAGSDISIVQSRGEIEAWMLNHPHPEWILQDYIKSPALKDGHKFHLRVPILVYKKTVWIFPKSQYYVAKEPYKKEDWLSKSIHDSHWNPEFSYMYPDDLPDGWKRSKELIPIVQKVFEHIALKPDWNSGKSFYLFGADIMFDKRIPILLEVNAKIGLKSMEHVIPGLLNVLQHKPSDFVRVL
jgi:hypothetical protein